MDSIRREARLYSRASDSLAKKPKIAEVRAICRNRQNFLEASTVSINDIVEKYGFTELMKNDPEFREQMFRMSQALNSTDNRF